MKRILAVVALVASCLALALPSASAAANRPLWNICHAYGVGRVCVTSWETPAHVVQAELTYAPAAGKGFTPSRLTFTNGSGSVVKSLGLCKCRVTTKYTSAVISIGAPRKIAVHGYFSVASGATSLSSATQLVR